LLRSCIRHWDRNRSRELDHLKQSVIHVASSGNETTMKIDLWHESYIDLNQPQHIAALRNLINALMKSVGERGEFRIELGGAPHYGTYTVTKPREMVEVRVTALKKLARKSLNTSKRSVAVGAQKERAPSSRAYLPAPQRRQSVD
jgi:hypothetical protein